MILFFRWFASRFSLHKNFPLSTWRGWMRSENLLIIHSSGFVFHLNEEWTRVVNVKCLLCSSFSWYTSVVPSLKFIFFLYIFCRWKQKCQTTLHIILIFCEVLNIRRTHRHTHIDKKYSFSFEKSARLTQGSSFNVFTDRRYFFFLLSIKVWFNGSNLSASQLIPGIITIYIRRECGSWFLYCLVYFEQTMVTTDRIKSRSQNEMECLNE